jgi:hypothetical protein
MVLGAAGAATGAGVAAVAGRVVTTIVEHNKVMDAAAAVNRRRQVECGGFIKGRVFRVAVDVCPLLASPLSRRRTASTADSLFFTCCTRIRFFKLF